MVDANRVASDAENVVDANRVASEAENVVDANRVLASDASDSIQIGVDQERMAAVSATDVLVPTESDSAPRWLSNCPKDGAGGFIVEKAWAAAIESAHGQGYGVNRMQSAGAF